MNRLISSIALSSDLFLNRVSLRGVRVRKGAIEITPRPLVTRDGVTATEGLGAEMGTEAVDGWTVNVPVATMERLFGSSWRDAIAPLASDWEINEDDQGWRKVRVSEQPTTGEGGRVVFKLLILGFDLP